MRIDKHLSFETLYPSIPCMQIHFLDVHLDEIENIPGFPNTDSGQKKSLFCSECICAKTLGKCKIPNLSQRVSVFGAKVAIVYLLEAYLCWKVGQHAACHCQHSPNCFNKPPLHCALF